MHTETLVSTIQVKIIALKFCHLLLDLLLIHVVWYMQHSH